jgi:hypothetical protein
MQIEDESELREGVNIGRFEQKWECFLEKLKATMRTVFQQFR